LTLGVLAALAGSSASSSSSNSNVEPGVFLLRSMNKQFHKITPPAGPADDRADDQEARIPPR
jgi:hypothetical protein